MAVETGGGTATPVPPAGRKSETLKTLRYILWGAVVAVAITMGALLVWPERNPAATSGPFGGPFRLVDHDGRDITEAAFADGPTLVFFGFTHCPEVCPTTLFEMNGWIRALGPDGDRIRAYFVTVDPERDTPDVLRDYVTSVSDRVTGISGDPGKVSAYVRQAGIYARKVPTGDGDYTMDHTATVFLLDGAGALFGTIAWGEPTDTAIAKLKRLVAKG